MPVSIETLANTRLNNGDSIYFGTDIITSGAFARMERHGTTARFDLLLPSSGMKILPYQDDGGVFQIGDGTTDMDVKIYLGDTDHYVLFNVGDQRLDIVGADVVLSADLVMTYTDTLTSQTTENIGVTLTYSTDSTYFTGGNITYSGAYTSSALKIVGTFTGTTGGLHGLLIQMNMDEDFTAAAEGILAMKSYLDMNGSAITEGNFMAGAFIAKKSGAGTMATGAILHGIEAWTYATGTSVVGTMIGGNIGYHADSSGDCSSAGTVWKALQVFCDNGAMTNPAQETSGIDIWAIAGTIDNALKIGPSSTFTRGILFVGGVGEVTTGIKFGGTAIGGTANVTMTTGIDMSETTGMTTMLVGDSTLTSQTTENKFLDITFSTDSTYTSGNIMWSGSTASTVLKISGTHDNTEGALYGVAVFLTCDNNYAADGDGAIAVRGLVTLTDTAVTNGDVTGGFFVGKKTGSGDAHASFILYGIEAWAYIAGTGQTRTAIGANVGYHADTSADCSAAGSVWRGLQVFCDNVASDAYNAEETTGVYIWPHSGTVKNALCIGTGTGTFTTGIKFVGSSTTTTGIKFGGQASDTSTADVTMTTGIDMDECASMVTGISITATCSTAAIVVGANGSTAGDVVFYGAASGESLTFDSSESSLDLVAIHGNTVDNAMSITVTDKGTRSAADYGRGLYISHTVHADSALTGSAEVNSIGVDMFINDSVPYAYGIAIYCTTTGNPTMDLWSALSVYAADIGNAIANKHILDLGMATTNAPSGRHTFMRLKNHGPVVTGLSHMRLESAVQHYIEFEDGAVEPISAQATALSGVTTTHKIKCYIASTGKTVYIPLIESWS